MDDLTLITCSFNTPDVTINMLKSFYNTHSVIQKLLLIENSTSDETKNILIANNIPFQTPGLVVHSKSVDYAIKQCKTKYALLVDTDIIFLKNIFPLFEQIKEREITLAGDIMGDRGGKKLKPRVQPWFCFIDIENVNNNSIHFFDNERLGNGSQYDVGTSFFEDIKNKSLKIADVKLDTNYFIHYEGMSWRTQTFNPDMPDTDIDRGGTHPHRGLYNAGLFTQRRYDIETVYLKSIDIKDKFI